VDVCLESGCSSGTAIGLSVIVIVTDRGTVRGVRGRSRGIDHGDDGADVVEARIGSVKGGGARGIAVRKEAAFDMTVGVEVVGDIAVAAIVLGEGCIAVEVVEVVVDCSLEGEGEDIQAVEACDLDCTVQLGSGSDSVLV